MPLNYLFARWSVIWKTGSVGFWRLDFRGVLGPLPLAWRFGFVRDLVCLAGHVGYQARKQATPGATVRYRLVTSYRLARAAGRCTCGVDGRLFIYLYWGACWGVDMR